jgi:hypothetical protein
MSRFGIETVCNIWLTHPVGYQQHWIASIISSIGAAWLFCCLGFVCRLAQKTIDVICSDVVTDICQHAVVVTAFVRCYVTW